MNLRQWMFFVAVLTVALACFVIQSKSAAASRLLTFQGRLTDAQGNVIADGPRVVQFKIYDAPVGGQAVWDGEVQKLTVNGGLVSTLLGSKANLSHVDFDRELYLELTVDANGDGQITAADPPLLPRQNILPAVFSAESADSRKLKGHDWSALFAEGVSNPATARIAGERLIPGSITSFQIASNTVTGGQLANETISSAHIAPASIARDRLEGNLIIDSIIPPGTINAFGGTNVPPGWLICDGRAISSGQYPRLFAAISRNWGGGIIGSTNDFNLPDLRGVFLRGMDTSPSSGVGTAGRDPDRENRVAFSPTGNPGNSGNKIGTYQGDEFASHIHTYRRAIPGADPGTPLALFADDNNNFLGGDYFPGINPSGGSETRPKNAYVHYIIKY